MRAGSMCISCLLEKQERQIRPFDDEARKSAYMHRSLEILYRCGQTESSPQLAERLNALHDRCWGRTDYGPLKRKYNQLLLRREGEIERKIRGARDEIRECIKYVCAANYIDFLAVEDVREEMLEELFDRVEREEVPEEEYARFAEDLREAKRLVYLLDNCGEIVLDKIFIRFLKEKFPQLEIHAIARGEDVMNDATMQDAREVGLTEIVACVGNGNGAPGTVIPRLSEEARRFLLGADVIISKGQGNFEGLFGEGLNPYYFFLCKCDLFVRRFGLRRYESVFMREERLPFREPGGR